MKIGIIDNVDIASEEGVVYVNVTLGVRNYKSGVEFWQPAPNIVTIPSEGDPVIVAELGAGRFVAMHAKPGNTGRIPRSASEGDVFIGGDADIYLGDPNNATAVADASHTHDFSGTDSGGDTFSGTTTGPSSTTETQIE